MNLFLKVALLLSALSSTTAHTHEEIAKCSLTAVHKTRQTTIESPNYPNNYRPDACWDYVIRSPYRCPTKFHIQFLDFDLEFSKDCKNDYLAIGFENIDDDMDVLCGQVVGIKKYHTPDGILRLRFYADESPWTTGKGFKLLVTRLACEREELLRELTDHDDGGADKDDDEDNIAVMVPSRSLELPNSQLLQLFRNLSDQEQYQILPLPPFSLNYPTQLPSPPYPVTVHTPTSTSHGVSSNYPGSNVQDNFKRPCTNDKGEQGFYGALKGTQMSSNPNSLRPNVQANYLPSYIDPNNINQVQLQQAVHGGVANGPRDQYVGSWSSVPGQLRTYDNTIDSLEGCCVSVFQQKRFYLSSPGFPRTIFSNILPNLQKRDCVFQLQKSASSVCRLRLDFKFFDFGQNFQGTDSFMDNIGLPSVQSTQNVCHEEYIEIEGQRFCGCRSGYVFIAHWTNEADKKLRMRMGYSGIPSGGFLLEILQEECTETQLASMTTEIPINTIFTTLNPNLVNNQLIGGQQAQKIPLEEQKKRFYGDSYSIQQQHQHQHQHQPQIVNSGFFPGNYPLQQSNYHNVFPSHLPQQNPLFNEQQQEQQQQQQLLQSFPNSNPYLSQLHAYYLSSPTSHVLQHNIFQQQGLSPNSFGVPQIRYARSYTEQQPVTVVETNSTRKEYYYSEALKPNEIPNTLSRSGSIEAFSKWDRKDTNVDDNNHSIGAVSRERRKCTFDMGDILRLSIDILWITKPICYAPQRNWFTNWIG